MEYKSKKTIVIGYGVAGLSAALYLCRQKSTELTVLSHNQDQESTDDISKIVRIDYTDVGRIREAIEAQKGWQNEPFNPYYRVVGRIVAYDRNDTQTLDAIDAARSELGMERRKRFNEDVLRTYYESERVESDCVFVWNDDDGLVDWRGCLATTKKLIQKSSGIRKKITVVDNQVLRLSHTANRVTSIYLANGTELEVSDAQVIMAVGSWTSELLERSSITQPPHSRYPIATGIFAFTLKLNPEQRDFFAGKPAFSHIGHAEFIPPTTYDGLAKITWIFPFTNILVNSNHSHPRDLSQSSLAVLQLLEMKRWALKFIPKLKGAKVMQIRSYWDGMTPTQQPIISIHPQQKNLLVIAGLSYTRAKDLPTLGEYVVGLLHGDNIGSQYDWDPPEVLQHHQQQQPRLLARGNFADLELKAESTPEVQSWRQDRACFPNRDHVDEI